MKKENINGAHKIMPHRSITNEIIITYLRYLEFGA